MSTLILFFEMTIFYFKESFHGNKSCVFNFSVRIAIARIQHQSQKTV